MGQKVNPIGLRLGINQTWQSQWFSEGRTYVENLHEDLRIRDYLKKKLKAANVSKVIIERVADKVIVMIHSARPGLIIGKKGGDIGALNTHLHGLTGKKVNIQIVEIRKPDIDATLVAESVAQQLERRVACRRAIKRAIQMARRMGAEGIKMCCSGRLGGIDIARSEWGHEGKIPLHTLRSDIDYGVAEAHTTYGVCGVKVWLYRGQITEHDPQAQNRRWLSLQGESSLRT
jgi:small subunit ribosomal protein S3